MRLDPKTGKKTCPKCGEVKTADDFACDKKRLDGLAVHCRKCNAAYLAEHYINNKERYAKNSVEYWAIHPERYLLKACKQRARKKSILCTITEEDVRIPKYCPICNRLLAPGKGSILPSSPSVDMQDPQLGYTPENTWVICWSCNRSKQDMSGDDHIAFGVAINSAFKEYRERVANLPVA